MHSWATGGTPYLRPIYIYILYLLCIYAYLLLDASFDMTPKAQAVLLYLLIPPDRRLLLVTRTSGSQDSVSFQQGRASYSSNGGEAPVYCQYRSAVSQ